HGEEPRLGGDAGCQTVPVLRLLSRQQGGIDGRRRAQDLAPQTQVVTTRDPDAGGEQGRVPPSGVVPDPSRRVDLATADVRRNVGFRDHLTVVTLAAAPLATVTLDDQDPATGESGECHAG